MSFDANRMWLLMGAVVVAWVGAKQLAPSAPPAEPTAAFVEGVAENTKPRPFTRAECLARPSSVWVNVDGLVECVAYIAAPRQPAGDTALVLFDGDVPMKEREGFQKEAPARYAKVAQAYADRFNLPVYVIGRPGLMGTTGFHEPGGMRAEGDVMTAALDAIKGRHRFQRFAAAGQSGGSHVVAQFLIFGRPDMPCAVLGSGYYAWPRGYVRSNIFGEPPRSYVVPMDNVAKIDVRRDRRIFIIGDTKDTRTPFSIQESFARALTGAGHSVELVEVLAEDSEHHRVADKALEAAARCALGQPASEIRAAIAKK